MYIKQFEDKNGVTFYKVEYSDNSSYGFQFAYFSTIESADKFVDFIFYLGGEVKKVSIPF